MKTEETFSGESLTGKACIFRNIIVLVVSEEKNNFEFFHKRYYVLFPGNGIDIVSSKHLKEL